MGGFGLLPVSEARALSRQANDKALEIDPSFALSYALRGWNAMMYDTDMVESANQFRRALELDPTDLNILSNVAALLMSLGRLDESLRVDEYILARDPVNPNSYNNLGIDYLYAHRWDESIEAFRTLLRHTAGYTRGHYRLGSNLLLKGDAEAALKEFESESSVIYRIKGQALALFALGRAEASDAMLSEFIDRWGADRPMDVVHVYAWTDRPDDAFDWLRKAQETGIAAYTLYDPWLEPLKQDPRWLPFLESIGNSPAQLDAIEFKIALPQ
jgi:tetratricopeptide (TPR) repeat protein